MSSNLVQGQTQTSAISRRSWINQAFSLLAGGSLLGCGGGGQEATAAPSPKTPTSGSPTPAPAPVPGPSPAPVPAPAPAPGSVNNPQPFKVVRTGVRFATLRAAVEGAISGDTIQVAPGTYVISALGASDVGMTWIPGGINLHTLTVEWEIPGVMPVIDLSAYAYRDGTQGGRTTGLEAGSNNRSLTVRGLHLIGHPAGDSYGINSLQGYLPGVGYNGSPASTLTIEYCKLQKFADGIKATIYNKEITVNVRYTTIEDCTGTYLTHGIYMPSLAELNVLGCTFRTTVAGASVPQSNAGHLLKSRARTTIVRGSLFDPAGGCASCIEAPNGGVLIVEGNVILHYGAASNSDENPPIKFGFEESAASPDGTASDGRTHSIKIAQNTVRKDQPSWNGGDASRIGMIWVSASMTTPTGAPIPVGSIPTTVRNNIIGGTTCGGRTLVDYPNNTSVARSTISDTGVYTGAPIAGEPAVNDASFVWDGEFRVPLPRTDTRRGGR